MAVVMYAVIFVIPLFIVIVLVHKSDADNKYSDND